MADYRFEDFEIWKLSIENSDQLFDIVDELENKNKFRFAKQLSGAGMSISNNIAEGAGSFSKKEFSQFLYIAMRSTFECANILVILQNRGYIIKKKKTDLFNKFIELSKKITNFRRSLMQSFSSISPCPML